LSTTTTTAAGTRFFAGWIVVAAAFVILMTNSGLAFYGLAVYLEALTREQGFTTGSVSAATSLFFIVSGLVGRSVARFIERHDLRWPIAAGTVLSAFSLLLLGRVTAEWQVFVVYALFGAGFAGAGLVPATTVVTRWFQRRRSVALSVASTGLSVGGLTLTVLASALIDDRGLRGATPWLALVYVITVAVALPFMWPDPQSRGLLPDGEPPRAADVGPVLTGVTYDRAVRSRFFVLFSVAYVCFMGAQVGAIAQLAKLGSERVDHATGTLLVSVLALTSVVARLIGGVVAARAPLGAMTASIAACQGLAMVVLAIAMTRGGLLAGTVLFGATIGNLLMLQPLVVAETFGVRDYPRIFSLSQLIMTIGVAVGPFLLGVLRDAYSYRVAYLVAAAVSVVGSLILFSAGSVAKAKEELW
jgi:MFS family permease